MVLGFDCVGYSVNFQFSLARSAFSHPQPWGRQPSCFQFSLARSEKSRQEIVKSVVAPLSILSCEISSTSPSSTSKMAVNFQFSLARSELDGVVEELFEWLPFNSLLRDQL